MQIPTYREQVAAEVRAGLARRNLSRSDLADTLDLSYRTLSERLNCKSPFDLDEIHRIADFLGVSVLTLIAPERAA